MLFSDIAADSVRDKLIKLVEASVYCLHVLGEKSVYQDKQIELAYKELSQAMGSIVNEDISKHSEYAYILYRAILKIKVVNNIFI
jgi:hypothetical protein